MKFQMKKIKKIEILILFLIVFFGGAVRFYHLNQSPPSLNWDEASLGYDSYSILKTGKDQYGKTLPIAFRSFDDYKPPAYVYLSVPFIKILGPSPLAVRFLSALVGTLTIIVVYLISRKIFDGHQKVSEISLLSSFLLAISPWHLTISRPAFEANVGLFFFLFGILFLLYTRKNDYYFFLSFFFFALSLYSYHSYRIIVPFFLFLYLIFYIKEIIKSNTIKTVVVAFLFLFILCLPLIKIFFSIQGLARLESAGLQTLGSQGAFSNLFFYQYPVLLFFQKIFYLSWEIFGRFFGYFSPANLFFRGDNQPCHSIPNFSPFFFWLFPFWIIGINELIKNVKIKETKIIILWCLASPIASSVTRDWFALVRTLPVFVAYNIVISLGITTVFSLFKKRLGRLCYICLTLLICFIFFQIIFLLETVFIYLPKAKSGDWQYGFEETVHFVAKIKNEYERIIVDSGHAQPFIFFLFYEPYPPEIYQKQVPLMANPQAPRKIFDFGPYYFRNIYWPKDRALTKTLFVGSEYSLPKDDILNTPGAEILSDFYDPSGNITFRIVGKK